MADLHVDNLVHKFGRMTILRENILAGIDQMTASYGSRT